MADKKISALTSLAQNDVVVSTDVLPIVDTSATETKKIAVNALVGAAAAAGLTNVDINSGTIDGATIATSDITVGSGKTLNVSAGTLTLADNQISGDKVEGGTINAITINTLTSTAVNATTVDATNVEVTNVKAKDGTASIAIADSTGVASLSANPILSGGTANGVLYLDGSKVATSGSAVTFNGTALAVGSSTANTNYLAVGGAVSVSNNYGTPLLSVASNSFTGVTVASHENTAASNGTYLGLMRSRGTQASPTNLLSGDLIGSLSGQVFNTAGANPYRASCAINLEADGNQASGDLPGRIVFGTVASGSTTVNERMRITSAGNVGIGTTSPSTAYKLTIAGSGIQPAIHLSNSVTGRFANINCDDSQFLNIWMGSSIGTSAIRFLNGGASGTERMRITDAGDVGIGTTSPGYKLDVQTASGENYIRVSSAANQDGGFRIAEGTTNKWLLYNIAASDAFAIYDNTATAERMRITSAGEVLVGGTTSLNAATGVVTLQGTNNNSALNLYRNDTSIASGNILGSIGFYGNDTTSNTPIAHGYIFGLASGTHSAGDNPTDISFGTTPDGTETVAEAGRITQAGSYVLKGGTTTAEAGVGVIFPATQVASANANSLDDYEEGTWTPVVADAASGGNASATVLSGNYTKIGNIVTVTAACVNISTSGLTAGNVAYIRGLPFASADVVASTGYFTGVAFTASVTIAAPPTVVLGDNGQTALNLNDGSAILVSDLTSGAADIWFTLTYQA